MYAKTKFRALALFAILFLTAIILLLASDMKADAAIYGGDGCGVNGGEISWSVDTQTGVLTVSGRGEMAEYSENYEKSPWRSFRAHITSVVIEEGITNISSYAFYSMDNIKSVSIPDSVIHIGKSAFRFCDVLVSVNIPQGVDSIEPHTFVGCDITSIDIPDSVTKIGERAFSDCRFLTKITVPDSVTEIGECAFQNCFSLESITLPFAGNKRVVTWDNGEPSWVAYVPFGYIFGYGSHEDNVNISQNTYYSNSNRVTTNMYGIPKKLKTVTVTGGELNHGVFEGCSTFTSIILGDSVNGIGEEAFKGCASLNELTIGRGVRSIGRNAFRGCKTTSLKINISDVGAWCGIVRDMSPDPVTGVAFAPYDFPRNLYLNGESLTDLVIPEGVTVIEEYAFYFCRSIKTVTFPQSLERVKRNAFGACRIEDVNIPSIKDWLEIDFESSNANPLGGCGDLFVNGEPLTAVVVPDEITSIGDYAFQGCDIISSAIIHDGVTEIGDYAFADCRELQTVDIGSGVNSIGKAAFKNCGKLSSAVFKETKGWWLNNDSEDVVRLLNYKLSNADYAAECLKEKYSDHEWRFGNTPMAPLVRKWSPVIVLFGFVLFEATYVLVEIMPDRKRK